MAVDEAASHPLPEGWTRKSPGNHTASPDAQSPPPPQGPSPRPVPIVPDRLEGFHKSNGLATAGFVCSLVGSVFGFIPILGLLGWPLVVVGLVLSAVGLGRSAARGRHGYAVAGLVLALVGVLPLVVNTVLTVQTAPFSSTASSTDSPLGPGVTSEATGNASAGLGWQDQVFLNTLRGYNIQFADETRATTVARWNCDYLDGGATLQQVLANIQGAGWGYNDAGAILGASVGAYCPRYLPAVQAASR